MDNCVVEQRGLIAGPRGLNDNGKNHKNGKAKKKRLL